MKKVQKILSVFLALVMTASTFMVNASAAPIPAKNDACVTFYGDVNSDGLINLKDCFRLALSNLHLVKLNAKQKRAADVNLDGKCNIKDVWEVLRVGLNLKLGVSADHYSWITDDTVFTPIDRNDTAPYTVSIDMPHGLKFNDSEGHLSYNYRGGNVTLAPGGFNFKIYAPKTNLVANLTASESMTLKARTVVGFNPPDSEHIGLAMNTEWGTSKRSTAFNGTVTGVRINNGIAMNGNLVNGKVVVGPEVALVGNLLNLYQLNVKVDANDLVWIAEQFTDGNEADTNALENLKNLFENMKDGHDDKYVWHIEDGVFKLEELNGSISLEIVLDDLYALAVNAGVQVLQLLPLLCDIETATVRVGGVDYICERYSLPDDFVVKGIAIDTFFTPDGNLCRTELRASSVENFSDPDALVISTVYDRQPLEKTDSLFTLPEGEYVSLREFAESELGM